MMGGREAGRDSEAILSSLEVMWRGLDVLWLPWIMGVYKRHPGGGGGRGGGGMSCLDCVHCYQYDLWE